MGYFRSIFDAQRTQAHKDNHNGHKSLITCYPSVVVFCSTRWFYRSSIEIENRPDRIKPNRNAFEHFCFSFFPKCTNPENNLINFCTFFSDSSGVFYSCAGSRTWLFFNMRKKGSERPSKQIKQNKNEEKKL